MGSIIIELQREALDSSLQLSDLLRKALLVSRKLQINELKDWVLSELNGYSAKSKVPDYRIIRGDIKAWNPYNGIWMPVIFNDSALMEQLSTRSCIQPIAEIESFFIDTSKRPLLTMPFSHKTTIELMRSLDFDSPPTLHVSETQIHKILNGVRNTILEWTLRLEERGIVGENLTFSKEEKKAAKNVTFNIGKMVNSQIQYDTAHSSQSMNNKSFDLKEVTDLIKAILKDVSAMNLEKSQKEELIGDLKTIDIQIHSPNPKSGIIKETLSSLERILEGAAGGLIASGLATKVATLINMLPH